MNIETFEDFSDLISLISIHKEYIYKIVVNLNTPYMVSFRDIMTPVVVNTANYVDKLMAGTIAGVSVLGVDLMFHNFVYIIGDRKLDWEYKPQSYNISESIIRLAEHNGFNFDRKKVSVF